MMGMLWLIMMIHMLIRCRCTFMSGASEANPATMLTMTAAYKPNTTVDIFILLG